MNCLELLKKKEFYQKNKNKLDKELSEKINKAFDISYTYNSTTIKGNTLTLIETKAVLEDKRLDEINRMIEQEL